MERRIKGVGESCWKRCCTSITIVLHGAAVPIRRSLSAPGLLGLGKIYEVAMYLYLLYSPQRKIPENFHFAHLEKFTCCRIPFFESGLCAFTSSSGLWGLFWPVPFHWGSQDFPQPSWKQLYPGCSCIAHLDTFPLAFHWGVKVSQNKQGSPRVPDLLHCASVPAGLRVSPGWFLEGTIPLESSSPNPVTAELFGRWRAAVKA